MNLNELIVKFEDSIIENSHIELSEEVFGNLNKENIEHLFERFDEQVNMLKLPHSEIKFFEWLKENDSKVWDDLWKTDIIDEIPYLVSFKFLKKLVNEKARGLPICDLQETDNYYFAMEHMVDAESEAMITASRDRFQNRDELASHQLLALEISLGAIDIWHFAYKYKMSVNSAKDAAQILIDDDALVHLTDAEHLSALIEF